MAVPNPAGPYRMRSGDSIRLNSFSSIAVEGLDALVTVMQDDGQIVELRTAPQTTSTNRAAQTFDGTGRLSRAGWVVGALVTGTGNVGKRGQTYVALAILNDTNKFLRQTICKGYLYPTHSVVMGEFEEAVGGRGFLSWVAAFTGDRAGNAASVDFDLFATRARRKVYGVAWYYHCSSDVATRTLISPTLIGLGGTKPTGFTQTGLNAYFWNTSNVTLTANEEGTIASYAGTSMGRTVTVDDGVATIIDTSVTPTPWPLWVTEDDVDTVLRFGAITNGEAADRHSAFVLIEEWIEP